MIYIAYGSNLHLGQMAHRCHTATVIGASELKDYDLLFRGSRHSAVATVEPLKGGSVPVLLWDIKKRDEKSLDIYEGWPNFYRKEIHEVKFDGKNVPAMVYIMNGGHDYGAPSKYYYNTIREGYASAGFDVKYLDKAVEQSMQLAFDHDELAEAEMAEDLQYGDEPSLFNMRW